jgi:protein TonB
VPGGSGAASGGGAFFEWQVEKPVAVLPGGRGPQYPTLLRDAGVEGVVLAQFVVDTLGRAELSTFRALRSDHPSFTGAVQQTLRALRFLPAAVGGRKVPQVVQQSFQFRLQH